MRVSPMQYVRHTILSEDVWAEEKILVVYWLSGKDDFDFEYLGTEADIEENDLQNCKSFHNKNFFFHLQNLIDDNLHKMISNCLTKFREAMDRDIQLNGWT